MSSYAESKDLLGWLQNGYDKKRQYFEHDRNRWIDNAKIYWGVDGSQYPSAVLQQLLSEGRQAPTLNVMAQKMDGLRGSLLRNQFDMKYIPIDESSDAWALKLQNMWYSDKENMNWDWSYDVFLRDFLIQYGAEWMYIDQSQSPFGNIAFKPDFPYNLFPDPNWKTPFHKDMMELDKIAFYNFKELKRLYPEKARELDEAKLRQTFANRYQAASLDFQYPNSEVGPAYQQLESKWDGKQLVIERHEIIVETRDWEYNIRDGEWFPDMGHKPQSLEDITAKKHYLEQRGLGADDIRFIPQPNRRYHVSVGCPAFDTVFENRDSIIQIGIIPCLITGPAKMGTQYRGIGDLAKDVQLNINKYIMMMQEILDRSARGGYFLDENIVRGDLAKMKAIEGQWNKSSARMWVNPQEPGMMDKYIKETPASHIPQDLMSFHSLMNEYADKLTYQTPAAEGRVESAKESGKLFQSKFEAHMIARGAIDTMLTMHEHAKAEMYLLQAKNTYSGIPRTFSLKNGKESFEINAPKPGGMEWDISQAGRHKVVIQPSQRGVDVRINQRGVYMELKQAERDPLISALYNKRILKTIELPEEEKEEAMAANDLVIKEAATAKALNIANMQAQMQTVMNPQQMGAQEATAQGGAEGAIPPEQGGAPIPPMTPGKRPTMEEGAKGTPLEMEAANKRQAGLNVPKQ